MNYSRRLVIPTRLRGEKSMAWASSSRTGAQRIERLVADAKIDLD